jgi:hypothetical protein
MKVLPAFRSRLRLGLGLACLSVSAVGCGERIAGSTDEFAPALPPPSVPNQLVAQVAPGWTVGQINAIWGTSTLAVIPNSAFALLSIPIGRTFETLSAQLLLAGACTTCERNYRVSSAEAQQGSIAFYEGTLTSTDLADQTAMTRVRAVQARLREDGSGVKVAVLDTGVDASHPALASHVGPGWDFVAMDASPQDEADGLDQDVDGAIDEGAGHGTHIAGVIAFIAPGASLVPVRVLDSEGNGTVFGVAQGVDYATQADARVINMSLALNEDSSVAEWTIRRAHERGALLVASAGNDGTETDAHFPANMAEVMGVAAVDAEDRKASFSSYGATVALGAPGVGIVSTYRFHGYATWSGTSMAAAFVSGAGAIAFGADGALTADGGRSAIEEAAAPFSHAGQPYEGLMGAGRLDVLGIVFHPIEIGS